MGPSEIVTLALSGAFKIGQLIADAVASRKQTIEEARAKAHVALDELIDTAAALRARVEADDSAAIVERVRAAAAANRAVRTIVHPTAAGVIVDKPPSEPEE